MTVETHKEKMARKKAAPTPVFQPMPNRRHEAFVNQRVSAFEMIAELAGDTFNRAEAYREARQALVRSLPSLPIAKRHPRVKVTKNNNPEYRK